MPIELVYPAALLLAPLPWLFWRFGPTWRDVTGLQLPARVLQQLSGADLADQNRQQRPRLRWWLAMTGWLALVGALATPVSPHGPMLRASGRDLLLVVDSSASMTERDAKLDGLTVQRFDALKQLAGAFMRKRQGDRIGLIAFAEKTYLIAPLTYDVDAAVDFLDEVVVGLPGKKTAIGDAIGLATKTLSDQPDASRVVILLSDGDSNAGTTDPGAAAELARRHNIRVHAIGFGRSLGPSGDNPTGLQPASTGLQKIAQHTGGQYFVARTTAQLRQVYQELDRIEPTRRDAPDLFAEKDWVKELLLLALASLAGLTWIDRRAARL